MYNLFMVDQRNAILKLAKKFDELCKNNNIFYALDHNTLLGALRHGGFVPWCEKFQVMMSLEGYARIKRYFPQMIIDNDVNSNYNSLKSVFVYGDKDIKEDQPFVEIRILVPTTIAKLKKFRGILYGLRNRVSFFQKLTQKKAINFLFDNKHEGFLLLEDRKQSLQDSWLQAYEFERETIKFHGYEFFAPKNFKRILTNFFGKNYMKAIVPKVIYNYLGPIKTIKENL